MPENIRELEIIVPSQETSSVKMPQVPNFADRATFHQSTEFPNSAKFMLFVYQNSGAEEPFVAIGRPGDRLHADIRSRINRDTGNTVRPGNIRQWGGGFYLLTNEEPVRVIFHGRSETFGRFNEDLLQRAMEESGIQTKWEILRR